MRRAAPLLALLALSVVLAPPAAAMTASPADPAADRAPAVTVAGAPDHPRLSAPANTTIEIVVHPNRSARWQVTLTYTLDSANETAAFRRYAEAYRTGETDVGPSAALFRRIVDSAAETTGRPMRVRGVTRSATVGESTGRLSLSFLWTNMLERTGNRTIRLGDAVGLPDNRTWINTLEPGQTLVVRTPDGYSVVDTDIPSWELRNNSVVVTGPARIEGDLQITYRRTGSPGPAGDTPLGLLAGVVVAVTLVAVVLYVRRGGFRRTPGEGGPPPSAGESSGGGVPDAATDGSAPPETAEPTEPAIDEELLSDEERIERLLRANDGRMKQATIVRETGWSDAKVSQLLSSMADEGRVDKLRLGRENLISLPDEEDDDGVRD